MTTDEDGYTMGSQHGNPRPAPEDSYAAWWMNAEIERQRAAAKAAAIATEVEVDA